MTSIETTAFAGLEKEGRLLNAVYKGPTGKPGYCAFRGDFALEFQVSVADEKRPPLYSFEGVIAIAKESEPTIEVFAGYLHNMAYIEAFKKVVGPLLSPKGTYFIFVNNIDFLKKYTMPLGDATLTILPCDEFDCLERNDRHVRSRQERLQEARRRREGAAPARQGGRTQGVL